MSAEIINGSELTFSFAHGRHFRGEHYVYLCSELGKRGINCVAPTFDVEGGKLSIEDHAKHLAEAEEEARAEQLVRIGHSWGANIIPRALTPAVKMLIFDAGVFYPGTVTGTPGATHSMLYQIIRDNPGRNLKGLAPYAFFQCGFDNPERQQWASNLLRDHPRMTRQPILENKPDIPSVYIVHTKDFTIPTESQEATAKGYGVEMVRFNGDHGSMVTRPQKLANLLIELVQEKLEIS